MLGCPGALSAHSGGMLAKSTGGLFNGQADGIDVGTKGRVNMTISVAVIATAVVSGIGAWIATWDGTDCDNGCVLCHNSNAGS